jgi:magnesium chelatase family protein
LAAPPGEASDPVRHRVAAARQRLESGRPDWTKEATKLLDRAVERLPLSGRGRARARRVAETIAALASEPAVGAEHLAEALAYRSPTELGAP